MPAAPTRKTQSATLVLLYQLKAVGLPPPQLELRFAAGIGRKWRFDLAWPTRRLAVEVDGGGFIAGRHSRGLGIERDCEKLAHALILGWRVLRVTPAQVKRGEAIAWVEQCLKNDAA